MVDQLTIQTIGVIVAAFSFVVGIANNILTSRREEKRNQQTLETRQAQLLMQIYDRNCDPNHQELQLEVLSWDWKDLSDFQAKYGRQNPSAYSKWIALNQWYEGIGVLIKNELISPKLVDDLISYSIMQYWEKYGPMLLEARKRVPQAGEGSELLYNSVRRIAVSEHPELKNGIKSVFKQG